MFLNCRSVCESQNPQNHRVDMKQKKITPPFFSFVADFRRVFFFFQRVASRCCLMGSSCIRGCLFGEDSERTVFSWGRFKMEAGIEHT